MNDMRFKNKNISEKIFFISLGIIGVLFLIIAAASGFAMVKAIVEFFTNDERWIGAIGSVLGGIIGGAITLTVMFKTNKVARDNNEKTLEEMKLQRELSIEPCMNINFNHENFAIELSKDDVEDLFLFTQKFDAIFEKSLLNFSIENIGVGPAKDIEINILPDVRMISDSESGFWRNFYIDHYLNYCDVEQLFTSECTLPSTNRFTALKSGECKNLYFVKLEQLLKLSLFNQVINLTKSTNRTQDGEKIALNPFQLHLEIGYQNLLSESKNNHFILLVGGETIINAIDGVKIEYRITLDNIMAP